MSEKYAIRIHDLSKRYKVGVRKGRRYRMLRDVMFESAKAAWKRRRKPLSAKDGSEDLRTLWALKDINFDVMPGDSLAIVGNNGAGKSTLLKILSRVTVPTTGFAHLRGRVGSLLEVGTGFHPELTGRENIYLNGAILGMRKREIDRKFDEIVAFSEVEKFLDTAAKFYSSGMRVRLAFSVAAHLEPEILLVDEVLAVGDVAFQRKSISRMEEVAKEGRTVIFVSHNMAAVRSLCKSGVYLEKGQIKYIGDVDTTVKAYLDSGSVHSIHQSRVEIDPNPSQPVQFLSVAITNNNGDLLSSSSHERPFFIEVELIVRRADARSYLALEILDEEHNTVISSFDFEAQKTFSNYEPGSYKIRVEVPPLLVPGEYHLSLRAVRKGRKKEALWDSLYEVCTIEIVDGGSARAQAGLGWSGKIVWPLHWEIMGHVSPGEEYDRIKETRNK